MIALDKDVRQYETEQVIRSLGVSGVYMGLPYLAHAVNLVLEDRGLLYCLTKILYPAVALHFSSTPYMVERDIRTIAKAIWDFGDHSRLDEMAGYHVKLKPKNSELIDFIANYIQRGK